MKDNKGKNTLFIDMNSNEKTFLNKIYYYFYSLFEVKKEYNLFIKSLLILIESIQIISYAFSSVHYNSWKLGTNTIKMISNIIEAFRLSIFMKFITYKIYTIISYLLIIFIFVIFLTVILQIFIFDSSSKTYKYSSAIIKSLIDILSIIFYIPITEIILLSLKCTNGIISGVKDEQVCWENIHYLNVILGCLGAILLFLWCIFMVTFSFYPFEKFMSTMRINSNNDIIILVLKLFLILQNLLISNEHISLFILLLISITMAFFCYNDSTYNNDKLEIIINIKNFLIIWTFFILLFSKLFETTIADGFIYLLIFGYPIIIILALVIYKNKDYKNTNIRKMQRLNDYVKKAKFNIKLIDYFFEKNKNVKNGNETDEELNLILLNGNIKLHNMSCTNEDCPLTKFVNNEGNFNVQKQCLLNYMNIFFNHGLKLYPRNFELLMLYINFNFTKKFNLNSVKSNLFVLKKLKCSVKEKFIIYCMEQNIKNVNNNNGLNFNDDKDDNSQVDTTEQKYQKLRYLIVNSIKLYGEFWGIFSNNVTNNLNTNKLYSLGEKLNVYLSEINNLWENELKNKKINNEYQNVVQLYSKFLLEILWDHKKSKEVHKKLNDENLNNYNLDKNIENNNNKKLEDLADNQDYLLFADSDEKGNSKIMQSSESFSHLLGYQKYDIIGKPLGVIYPSILVEGSCNYLQKNIQLLNNGKNNKMDLSYRENNSNKNAKLIMVKNRMGYIFPLLASFMILDDNDYSDSYLVKIKMEMKDSKSEYAYYIMTNLEFSIENISSSAINLGLSLDIIKKYSMKMDILLRTKDDDILNIYKKLNEFEEEQKIITWVFPDIIYPKDNIEHVDEDEIERLVSESKKKKYFLQIKPISFDGYENVSFLFKFTELSSKKKKKKIKNEELFRPQCDKNLILFDLLNLNYVRTIIVNEKSGMRNLRNDENEEEQDVLIENKNNINKKGKNKKNLIYNEEEDDDDYDNSDKKNNNLLTKEKVIELQANNYIEIRNFVFELPMYGSDVALEKFRPNGDRYSASKITESLIKIKISKFCKTLEEKYHFEQNFKKKKSKLLNINNNNNMENPNPLSINNNEPSASAEPTTASTSSPSNLQTEEMNKGLISDTSSTLLNIFKVDSIKYIIILIGFLFIITILLILVEYLITNSHFNKIKTKLSFLKDGYFILNSMLYTKFFVTEGIIANSLSVYSPMDIGGGKDIFLKSIQQELAYYRQEFTQKYDSFSSNELSKEYKNFMASTNITIFSLTINNPQKVPLLFNSAMNRISSSINDLASDSSLMNIDNRDAYELMHNLINEYYINWKKVVSILYNDTIKATNLKIPLLFILFGYFFISIIILFIFLKFLSIFSADREKPINLFLTLKKKVFENLKQSSENFSNQLLNKLFGNEDDNDEEESQEEYEPNIQKNDINIVKFKAANEYNSSIKKGFSFINIIIIVMIFFLCNLIYFMIKYFDFRNRMENIFNFIILYEKNYLSETYFVLSIDIFKSYLYNKSIPILNKVDTKTEFFETFINISDNFEQSILYVSKTKTFLKGEYLKKYLQYLQRDFSELIDEGIIARTPDSAKDNYKNGIKPIETKIFEIIRFLFIRYCNNLENNIEDITSDEMSKILNDDFNLFNLNFILENIVRPWYVGTLKLMLLSFNDFQSSSKFIYIILFICLMVLVILYYCIIWKSYEKIMGILLKKSANLINLIPQEIKNLIIEKLNE